MWLNRTEEIRNKSDYQSYKKAFGENNETKVTRWLALIVVGFLLLSFLPWTQTIQAPGIITTRSPEQRPQEVNSVIAGRIEKWFVKEGDLVKKGDTILKITEVKENYLDPQLLQRRHGKLLSRKSFGYSKPISRTLSGKGVEVGTTAQQNRAELSLCRERQHGFAGR